RSAVNWTGRGWSIWSAYPIVHPAVIIFFAPKSEFSMTPIEKQNLLDEIERIKASIETEVQLLDGYNDELREVYLPIQYYLKLDDYKTGLKYLRWYQKIVHGDVGAPDFIFECSLILFMNDKLKEAKRKAVEAFFNNTYIFDKFFGRELAPIDKLESWDNEKPEYLADFKYSSTQPQLAAFSQWLSEFERSDKFQSISKRFIAALIWMKYEKDRKVLEYLSHIDDHLMKELHD
ncbi:MAG TPA: hypothetical protein PLE74_12610, partial [Candidatus Cloacimonadota bacterium]|nr:hypothetical protein [Candidatus Cloacimonadota bacterium]